MATATGCRRAGTAATFSKGPPVHQPGERVGRRLQLGLGHDPQQADPGAGQVGQRGQVVDLGRPRTPPRAAVAWITPTVRPMIDTGTHTAETRPCGRSRSFGHASRSSLSAKTCTWARRAAGQWSGESTPQPGGSPSGPTPPSAADGRGCCRPAAARPALGHDGGERPLDDVDHLGLALGHVQRVGQPALEALALALQLAGNPFAVGDLDRLTQLVGQCTDLVVGLALLTVADDDQEVDQREEEGHEDAGRHGIGSDPCPEGPPDGHGRDGEQAEDDQSGQGADEAEPLGLRHLAMPFLFSDHAHDPFTRCARWPQRSRTTHSARCLRPPSFVDLMRGVL